MSMNRTGSGTDGTNFALRAGRWSAATDQRFRAAVGDVVRAVSHAPNVANVRAPYRTDGQISKNGHAAIVRFDLPGDSKTASNRVKPVLGAVAAVQRSHPGFYIQE